MARVFAGGLRRRGIDLPPPREAALTAASDRVHIEYARQSRRVVVTDDADFLGLARSGITHSGIVYCRRATHTIGQIIEHIVLVDVCFTEAEMFGHVEFC